jgi:allophanate hydrolase subunit 2
MGIQLEELFSNKLPDLPTNPVFPGTVQLTPSGKIIVLMRDAGVTGGYPRILQLTEDSINRLAQKKTGDSISFQLI